MNTRTLPATLALALGLAACAPKPPADTSGTTDTGNDTGNDTGKDTGNDTGNTPVETTAVVVTTDFSVGSLATVDLDGWAVHDELNTTSGDPDVVHEGEWIVEIDGFGADFIRIWEPGSWSAPLAEFTAGRGNNPHDAALCGGRLFVSLYERNALAVYDTGSWTLAGTVDLSAYDDGDGKAEPSGIEVLGDRLYVALQQLDRDHGWVANGGMVAEVDCQAMEVTRDWEVGGDPEIFADPSDPGRLVVQTGTYGEGEGGLELLEPGADPAVQPLLDEADAGMDIAGFAGSSSGHGIALGSAWDGSGSSVLCVDLADGSFAVAGSTPSWLARVSADDRGEAWISSRVSWTGEGEGGLDVWDIDSCTQLTSSGLVELGLDPYGVAFY